MKHTYYSVISLRWRHNGRDGVSNHQPHDCLVNRLFRHRSKWTSKLRVIDLCEGNSPGTGEFPLLMASNAENVSIWWRHHVNLEKISERAIGASNYVEVLLITDKDWLKIFQECGFKRNMEEWRSSILRNAVILNYDDVIKLKLFSALLALCARNPLVIGKFPSQRASYEDFDVSLLWVCKSCYLSCRMTGDLRVHCVHVTSS